MASFFFYSLYQGASGLIWWQCASLAHCLAVVYSTRWWTHDRHTGSKETQHIQCLLYSSRVFTLSICSSVYCDYFLHGLYTMFVGDARPSHSSDEWVYHDLDILKEVVLPAVRIALKLHQVSLMNVTIYRIHVILTVYTNFVIGIKFFTKFGIKLIVIFWDQGSLQVSDWHNLPIQRFYYKNMLIQLVVFGL